MLDFLPPGREIHQIEDGFRRAGKEGFLIPRDGYTVVPEEDLRPDMAVAVATEGRVDLHGAS